MIEHEGKVLVCQRRRGGAFELLWEFPGGKARPDETLESALARELAEELGVTAKIGREIYRTQHRYAEMSEPIELIFFAASVSPVEIQNLIFEQIEWRDPHSLRNLNFLPADRELIEKLALGEISPIDSV